MSEYAIEVENLCVNYKTLGDYSIRNIIRQKKIKNREFQAVKDVSFKVEKGGILGIIGKNGSGKSTTLRAIAGIFSADSGTINIKNNSISLLSIGVGFKPELSGRENVILSGMLLGFTKQQINEKMEGIIEFSELGEFIDKPVRTYSSGMYSKLAFSITANLETEIILIDEVLSVGDEKFAKKSYGFMKRMIRNEERTVVFVSHNINTLRELCTQIMWMHEGRIMEIGDVNQILDKYVQFMK